MHNNRDRPKQQKQKKSFSFKKLFESLKLKFRNRKQKAPKEQKTKAKNVSFKQRLNNFKAKMKNAFKVKIPKKEKTRSPNKQSASKLDKTHLTKAIGGVAVILALVAVIGVFGNIGGTKTVVKPVIGGGNDNGSINIDADYTVTFKVDGNIYGGAGLMEGQSVSQPVNPVKDGYTFVGWYTEETGGELVEFPYKPNENVVLYARFVEQTIVGFTGLTNSDSVLTLTGDVAGVGSYTTTSEGDYVTVHNNLDMYFPFNQIEEFTDEHGNVFVKYPKFWMKWILDENGYIDGISISNAKVDNDYFIPDAFLHPASYGRDEYFYCDYFALGKYEMSGDSSVGYSKTGAVLLTDISTSGARTATRSYGTSANYYNGYQQLDYAQYTVYNLLCMMYYQTSNIQNVWEGRSSSVLGHNWASGVSTGSTDGVGGMNGWNTATDCVKMLGIENPYGNIGVLCDGVYISNYNLYINKFPQLYNDSGNYVEDTGILLPSVTGFVKYFKPGVKHDDIHYDTQSYMFPVDVSGGSADHWVGDKLLYSSSSMLAVGGSYNGESDCGLWYCYFAKASGKGMSIGARLCYRPI